MDGCCKLLIIFGFVFLFAGCFDSASAKKSIFESLSTVGIQKFRLREWTENRLLGLSNR